MSPIAEELDRHLRRLDPAKARQVEQLVRDVLVLTGADSEQKDRSGGRPEGYFERTAGALAGEPFDVPSDPPPPERETW